MLAKSHHVLPASLLGFESIKRYWDRTNDCPAAKILPGEYYVTTSNELITTVLGSCVSACIRDRVFGIGGMNHFMLPVGDGSGWGGNTDILSSATRYGNYAMEHMINDILKNGGHRKNLEVKVFGGGQIIHSMTNIGQKNIEFVKAYIAEEGLRLVAEDLGDIYPRKIVYFPATGKVRMKKLQDMHNDTIIKREVEYQKDLVEKPQEGEIELF